MGTSESAEHSSAECSLPDHPPASFVQGQAAGSGIGLVRMASSLLAVILVLGSCTDLTELDSSYTAGVWIVSLPDMTVTASSGPIEGGRSVIPLPGRIWVATTGGDLLELDSEDLTVDTSITVGQPFAAGYRDMEISGSGNSVYLIGALGQILELDVATGDILDAFTICEAPLVLVYSLEDPLLYVADASTDQVLEVYHSTHGIRRSVGLTATPTCLSRTASPDLLLAGTSMGSALLDLQSVGYIGRIPLGLGASITTVTDTPGDTVICAVLEGGQQDMLVTFPLPLTEPCYHPVEGSVHLLCHGPENGFHTYLLSYIGNGTSRLLAYDYRLDRIDGSLEFQGYPLDMETTPSGNLVLLTTD